MSDTDEVSPVPYVGPWESVAIKNGNLVMSLYQENPIGWEDVGTITIRFYPTEDQSSWLSFTNSFDSRDTGRHTARHHFEEVKEFITDNPYLMQWCQGLLKKLPNGRLELFMEDQGGYIFSRGELKSEDETKQTILELRMSIAHHQYELDRLLNALNFLNTSCNCASLLDTYEPLPSFQEDLGAMFSNLESDTIEGLQLTDQHLRREFAAAKHRMNQIRKVCNEF